jgi:hypothetical protein
MRQVGVAGANEAMTGRRSCAAPGSPDGLPCRRHCPAITLPCRGPCPAITPAVPSHLPLSPHLPCHHTCRAITPAPPGVIIPVVEEMDPSDLRTSQDSWQYSACLKWGYADSIKLVSAVAGQQGIPGLSVSRSLVGAGWQGVAGCSGVLRPLCPLLVPCIERCAARWGNAGLASGVTLGVPPRRVRCWVSGRRATLGRRSC